MAAFVGCTVTDVSHSRTPRLCEVLIQSYRVVIPSISQLTDEIPARSEIAIPRDTQPVAVHHAPIAWHRFDADTFSIGRTEHALPDGSSIGLYSAERTLIDLFRLRHAWAVTSLTAHSSSGRASPT